MGFNSGLKGLTDPNISNVHDGLVSEVCTSSAGTPQPWRRHHGPAGWYNLLTPLHSVTPQNTKIFEYFLPCNFAVSVLGLLYFSRQLTSRIHSCMIFTTCSDHVIELNIAVCLQVQIRPYLGRLIKVIAYTGSSIRSWWF